MLLLGDCNHWLKEIKDNSIDLIVTDPPYGIEFMGKDWDKALVHTETWKECYRVLKEGKLAFVMCSPRQDVLSRMIINLQDAGFRTNYTSIYWTYASGFPKAANVSKLIDKKFKERTEYHELADYLRTKRIEKGYTKTQLGEYFKTSPERINHGGCVTNWETTLNVPTESQYIILKDKLGLDNRFDWLIEQETKHYEEAEREIVQKKRVQRNSQSWNDQSGMLSVGEQNLDITKPATEEAKKMEGSYIGFQPKPAVEVILVVSKGKTISWLDDCRIPYNKETDEQPRIREGKRFFGHGNNEVYGKGVGNVQDVDYFNEKGRFPANLVVSDDVLNDGKITKSSHQLKVKSGKQNFGKNTYDNIDRSEPWESVRDVYGGYNDSGSYSRYFSLDAWADKTFPFSKALNTENNSDGSLPKKTTSANIAEPDSETTQPTELNHNATSAQDPVRLYLGSESLNRDAKSAAKKQDFTETDTVLNTVPIRQGTETYQGILNMLEKEFSTLIMQRRLIQNNPNDANSVIEKLTYSIDTIQICINQLRLSGCVDPAIIEQMQQALIQDQQFQNLPEEVKRTFPFMVCAKASRSERNKGCEDLPSREVSYDDSKWGHLGILSTKYKDQNNNPRQNHHPTVKPLKLMSYLITMGSREGDLVLDPFCGSGTVCIAADQLHRKWIGIEKNEEYAAIIKKRLMVPLSQLKLSVWENKKKDDSDGFQRIC